MVGRDVLTEVLCVTACVRLRSDVLHTAIRVLKRFAWFYIWVMDHASKH